MIEVEYEGPRLRGLLLMLLTITAMILVIAAMPDPSVMTLEGWGFMGVGVIGAVVQLVDARRWARSKDTPI